MKCKKNSCFFVIDEVITQEKIQKLFFLFYFLFFFCMEWARGYIAKVLKVAVNPRKKFRNTHWPEKSHGNAEMPENNCFQKVMLKICVAI